MFEKLLNLVPFGSSGFAQGLRRDKNLESVDFTSFVKIARISRRPTTMAGQVTRMGTDVVTLSYTRMKHGSCFAQGLRQDKLHRMNRIWEIGNSQKRLKKGQAFN